MKKDKEFESALSAAAKSLWEERAATYDSVHVLPVQHSEKYAGKINAILNKKRPDRLGFVLTLFRRSFIAVTLMALLVFIIMLPVIPLIEGKLEPNDPSKQITVLEYVLSEETMEETSKWKYQLKFVPETEPEEIVRPIFKITEPEYLPETEKWTKNTERENKNKMKTTYKSKTGDIIELTKAYAGTSVVKIYSAYTCSETKVNGHNAYVIFYEYNYSKHCSVYFCDGIYEYFIDTLYSKETEAIKIAESIK